jgi:hypothetical protein
MDVKGEPPIAGARNKFFQNSMMWGELRPPVALQSCLTGVKPKSIVPRFDLTASKQGCNFNES